ncbi:hypothetical protein [Dysgonomonas capnocytophagoides]|uniref:hypothetical protein n=1 Tax=Dysgonomonas capnocytophagoides TaxID=45254 RepID=UPI00141B1AD2|nr:hypothetical protein [Dysgonomonas capnocytophagoides]
MTKDRINLIQIVGTKKRPSEMTEEQFSEIRKRIKEAFTSVLGVNPKIYYYYETKED